MSCVICLENLNENDVLLACNHKFHLSCLQRHFRADCPLCRRPHSFPVYGEAPQPFVPFSWGEPDYFNGGGPGDGTGDGIIIVRQLGDPFMGYDETMAEARSEEDMGSEARSDAVSEAESEEAQSEGEQSDNDYIGYNYREEHPDYDEENPHGDSWDYEYV